MRFRISFLLLSLIILVMVGCGYKYSDTRMSVKRASDCPEDSGTIIGRIIDSDTGETIRPASLKIDGMHLGYHINIDRSFRIGCVPAGTHTIEFKSYTHDSLELTNIEVLPNQTIKINPEVPCVENGGGIRGVIIDSVSGEPVPGSRVYISLLRLRTETDSNGEYRFNCVPPGQHNISIYYHKYAHVRSVDVVVEPNRITDLSYKLVCPVNSGAVAGTITDSLTGKPLPGIRVRIKGMRYGSTTDDNGEYRIKCVPPGKHTHKVFSPEHSTTIKTDIVVLANQIIVIDKKLPCSSNAGMIAGRITDTSTGEPVSGVSISIVGTNLKGYTDIDGEYCIDCVPPGLHTIKISVDEYDKVEVSDIEVKPDLTIEVNKSLRKQTREQFVLDWQSGAKPVCVGNGGIIVGTVTDSATGKPINWAKVQIVKMKGRTFRDHLDYTWSEGEYLICNVPPGIYTMSIMSDDYHPMYVDTIQVSRGDTVVINQTMIELDPLRTRQPEDHDHGFVHWWRIPLKIKSGTRVKDFLRMVPGVHIQ